MVCTTTPRHKKHFNWTFVWACFRVWARGMCRCQGQPQVCYSVAICPGFFVSTLHFISIFAYFVCGKEEGMHAMGVHMKASSLEGLGTISFTYWTIPWPRISETGSLEWRRLSWLPRTCLPPLAVLWLYLYMCWLVSTWHKLKSPGKRGAASIWLASGQVWGAFFLIADLSRRTQPCVGKGWWWDHSGSFL